MPSCGAAFPSAAQYTCSILRVTRDPGTLFREGWRPAQPAIETSANGRNMDCRRSDRWTPDEVTSFRRMAEMNTDLEIIAIN
jgi:hypothetical protein